MDVNIKSPICWSSATMLHLAIKSLYSYFSFEARDEPGDTLLAPAKSHRENAGVVRLQNFTFWKNNNTRKYNS